MRGEREKSMLPARNSASAASLARSVSSDACALRAGLGLPPPEVELVHQVEETPRHER
jgi:hypothetical protein